MKNIIKKMAIIIVVLSALMCLSGFTYQTEEVPAALIKTLVSEGFTLSENDDNIWLAVEVLDLEDGEYATAYGRFDTDENIGTITIYGEFTINGKTINYQSYVVTWDNIEQDMVVLVEFEY